jgi:hypothetical protein
MQIFKQEAQICLSISVGYYDGEFFAWSTIARLKETSFEKMSYFIIFGVLKVKKGCVFEKQTFI